MTVRRVIFIFSILIFETLLANAKIKLQAKAGYGLSYTKAIDGVMSYQPILLPHIATTATIPLSGKFVLESGLQYSIKGFNNKYVFRSGANRTDFVGKSRFHYLSVPILLNYNIYKSRQSKIWLGAGMSYGFFIAGYEDIHLNTYNNGIFQSTVAYKMPVTGALSNSSFLKNQQGKHVQLLDAMLRLQVNYMWKDRYILGIFHELSLQDIDAAQLTDANSIIKLRYIGLSLGFLLN